MSHAQLEQMLTESGLSVEEAPELVDVLAGLADVPEAPTPSAALAAVFDGRPAPEVVPLTGPRKRAVAGIVVLALSGVGATGLSAAANTLPRPLQHHVSEFSRHYLPFDLPEPPDRPARSAPQPAVVPSSQREVGDGEESSRSAVDRPGAGAPDASTSSDPSGAAATGQTQPSAAPSPSSSPAAAYAPAPKPSASPSPSGSPSASPGDDRGKDRDKGKPQDPGNKPGKGPDKNKPRPPGGGNELPQQPGPGEDPGGADPGGPAPVPAVPIPPLPLPDLPPTPGQPGNGIDVTLD